MQSPHVQRIFSTRNSHVAVDQEQKGSRSDSSTELSLYARKFFCSQKNDPKKIQSLIATCKLSLSILENNLKSNFVNEVALHFCSLPTLVEKEDGQFVVFPVFHYNETIFEAKRMERSLEKCKAELKKIKDHICPEEIQIHDSSIEKIDKRFQNFLSSSEDFRKEKESQLDKFFL